MSRQLITPEIRKAVLERDKSCVYCGLQVARVLDDNPKIPVYQRWRAYDANGILFHFDHKIPLAAGGITSVENIVLACPHCNLEKARSSDKKAAHPNRNLPNKVIKLSDQVYHCLAELKGDNETFSQAIERLLALMEKMGELRNILEGGIKFEEWKHGQEKIRDLQVR